MSEQLKSQKYTIDFDAKEYALAEYPWRIYAPTVKKTDGSTSMLCIAMCHDEGAALEIINKLNGERVSGEPPKPDLLKELVRLWNELRITAEIIAEPPVTHMIAPISHYKVNSDGIIRLQKLIEKIAAEKVSGEAKAADLVNGELKFEGKAPIVPTKLHFDLTGDSVPTPSDEEIENEGSIPNKENRP